MSGARPTVETLCCDLLKVNEIVNKQMCLAVEEILN